MAFTAGMEWIKLQVSDLVLLAEEMGVEVPRGAKREQLIENILALEWDQEDIEDTWLDLEKRNDYRKRELHLKQQELELKQLELEWEQHERERRKLEGKVNDSKDLATSIPYLFSYQCGSKLREKDVGFREKRVHALAREKSPNVATETVNQLERKATGEPKKPYGTGKWHAAKADKHRNGEGRRPKGKPSSEDGSNEPEA